MGEYYIMKGEKIKFWFAISVMAQLPAFCMPWFSLNDYGPVHSGLYSIHLFLLQYVYIFWYIKRGLDRRNGIAHKILMEAMFVSFFFSFRRVFSTWVVSVNVASWISLSRSLGASRFGIWVLIALMAISFVLYQVDIINELCGKANARKRSPAHKSDYIKQKKD